MAALLVVHFLVISLVGLEGWARFGLPMAIAAVVIVSIVFYVLLGIIQHKFVKLVVRES